MARAARYSRARVSSASHLRTPTARGLFHGQAWRAGAAAPRGSPGESASTWTLLQIGSGPRSWPDAWRAPRRIRFSGRRGAAVFPRGELLQEMAVSGERRKQGEKSETSQAARLSDLGIDESESHRFQQIAAVPQKTFDAHLAEAP
jgi:hypothetical protein